AGGRGQRLVRERALGLRRRVGRACGRGESKFLSSVLAGFRHPITLSAHYRGGPPECLARAGHGWSEGQASSDRLRRRIPKPIASSTPPAAATSAMSSPVNGSCPPSLLLAE